MKQQGDAIAYTKQKYSDGACEVADGAVESASITVGACGSSKDIGGDSLSYVYTNATEALSTTYSVSGLSVRGYQEYSYCAQTIRPAYEYVYPNNYCYASSGRTKSGVAYSAYSYSCTGKKLTQSFFSDASSCSSGSSAPVSVVTTSLETVDTTCYTNMNADFDYNLFETSVCVVASANDEKLTSVTAPFIATAIDKKFSSLPHPF